MRCVDRIQAARIFRSCMVLAALALVSACSSSADRLGSADVGDPRYAGTPQSGTTSPDRSYTASIPQTASYSREVSSGPLDDGSGYAPSPAPARAASTSRGGAVVVAPGDTLYSIARANHVDVDELIAVNGIRPPYGIKVGQTIMLPGSGASYAASSGNASLQNVAYHDVRPGDTLYSIARSNGLRVEDVARYNGIAAPYALGVGQRLRIPGGSGTAIARAAPLQRDTIRPQPVSAQHSAEGMVRTASLQASEPEPEPRRPAYTGKLPDPEPRAASKFRWPVKGRIISRFGTKPNGARNDGINISVPVGTSVKAAENGVVAYAGNELKGYGNLVLIRHADNWVTAYAHNSDLLVQRGDRVTRGQIIARAGQTGSVTSPQVHFEIRQGSKAVDPLDRLESTQLAGN